MKRKDAPRPEGQVFIKLDTDSLETLNAELDRFDLLSDIFSEIVRDQSRGIARYCDECWRLVTHTATVCWHCDAILGEKC